MLHRIIAALLVFAAVAALSPTLAMGQSDKRAEQIKNKIIKKGAGAKVTVKLYNETVYKGSISQANDSEFTVTDKTGSPHTVKYTEVKSLGGGGLSGGAKLAIGIGIGVGAVLAVLAAIIASND